MYKDYKLQFLCTCSLYSSCGNHNLHLAKSLESVEYKFKSIAIKGKAVEDVYQRNFL